MFSMYLSVYPSFLSQLLKGKLNTKTLRNKDTQSTIFIIYIVFVKLYSLESLCKFLLFGVGSFFYIVNKQNFSVTQIQFTF